MRRVTSISAVVGALALAMAAIAPVTAQDETSDHPLVGSWTTVESSTPDLPPDLVAFHPDGTAIYVSPEGIALGSWSPTGGSCANLTLVFPQTDPDAGPLGVGTARVSIEVSEDGGTFAGTYTVEFPTGADETTGQIGPGEQTGTRIAVEPMGEPVAPFPDGSIAPGASPMALDASPAAEASPMAEGSPAPAASPAA